MKIAHLGFLTPGNFPDTDPSGGLDRTLDLFRYGEDLGYDSAWVRQRHLERAVSSAATFLAAASQRTERIALGAAVIQMGYENPFRLAEDLASVDALSHGRLHVGLSAGAPPHGALLGDRLFDGDPSTVDFSHARVARLRDNLEARLLGDAETFIATPAGPQRPRLQPQAPGLVERLWYGGGSLRSADWAAREGFNLLISNVTAGEGTDDFYAAQSTQLDRFLSRWSLPRAPRVALGRVIVPLDSADAATRRHYLAFAADRVQRTQAPQGARRTLFPLDLVGTSDEILERLRTDPLLSSVSELRLELPYDFRTEEYEQILTDTLQHIAPELGWLPHARRTALKPDASPA